MSDSELEALFDEHGDWDRVVDALRARLEDAADDEARAEVWRLVAAVHAEWREDDEATAEALEAVLENAPGDSAAAESLVSLYARLEDFEAVTGVLIDHASHVEDPADRAELLRRAADVFDSNLGNAEGARLVLRKALSDAPLDQLTWIAVEERWTAAGAFVELAELLNEHAGVVAAAAGEKASLPLLLAVARAYVSSGQPALAEAFLTRAELLDEADEEILRAQVEAREQAEHWDALCESLERLADRTADAADEAELRRRLGRTLFDKLGDADAAVRAFSRAYELLGAPDDADTLAALYEARGRHRELADLLRDRADAIDGPEARVATLLRVAALERDALGEPDAARRTFEDVLVADPANERALAAIGELLECAEDWRGLADHVRRRADAAVDAAARIPLLVRRAELLETKLDDAAAAVATLDELRRVDDTTPGCLEASLRLLEHLGREGDRVEVHLRMADLDRPPGRRAHLADAARLQRALGRLDDAAATLRTLLQEHPGDAEALAELESLQTEIGDAAGAIASLRQRIEVAANASEKVALLLRLADTERAGDPESAADAYRQVLGIDPEHASAAAALCGCLEETAAWPELVRRLRSRVGFERSLPAKAALMARIGEVLDQQLGDRDGALAAWEEAIAFDPACADAARPLADAFMANEAWERALPMLRALVAAAPEDSDPQARRLLHADLGAVCELLGLTDDAIAAYEDARALDGADVGCRLALGRLYTAAGRHADADATYATLVDDPALELDESDRIELFTRAGSCAAKLGDGARASALLRRALALDAYYEPAVRLLADLSPESGDPRERLEAKQALLQLTDAPDARFGLLLEIADLMASLGFDDGVVEALEAALELRPDSKVALHKVLAAHTSAERWDRAIATLKRLTELEEDPARRDKFAFTIGAIYRDQLQDVERAAGVFSALLDAEPTRTDALDALQTLFTGVGAWKRLENELRRQLERIADIDAADDMRFAIVVRLGEIYRDHLDRPERALEAYRVAADLRPDDLDVLDALVAIYPPGGKTDADVIREHRAIVGIAPDRENSHHVLFAALKRERRFDEAWNEAAVLTVLGSRERGPTEFYAEHRPPNVPMARRGLSRAEWRSLQHPELSTEATRLLAAIAATLRRVYSIDVKDWGVQRKQDWIDVSRPGGVVNLFHYSAQVLGVAMPALYKWSGVGFQNANAEPRAVLVGSDVVSATSDRRMVFRIARTMCLMRNEFYLASALSPQSLVPLVQASISLFTGGPPREWDSQPVRAWMDAIGREPDDLLHVLAEAVAEYVRSGQSLNLRDWPRAVELTAGRVALLLCGDVQRAAQAAAENPRPLGGLDIHDRVLDLVRFASSVEYADLRAELGLGIGQG